MTKQVIEISAKLLSAIELFYDLSSCDRKVVADRCRGFRYAAGDIIASYDDIDNDVYFIISGKVHIAFYSSSGKEIYFGEQVAGGMFGEVSAVDRKPRSACVVSQDDTILAAVSADNFSWLMQLYPSIMSGTLKRFARLVRTLSQRVIEFNSLDVRNRLHAELFRLACHHLDKTDNSATITPAPRQVELASRISSHREAVSREMTELTSAGVIRKSSNSLRINDVNRLENMVRETAAKYK